MNHESKCPYESDDIIGQIKMEQEIDEWHIKHRTDYDSLITYLKESKGYTKVRKTITNKDTDFVTTQTIFKGDSGTLISISLPNKYKVATFMGADLGKISYSEAFKSEIKITDNFNNELDGSTKIEIVLLNPSEGYKSCLPLPYYIEYEHLCGKNDFHFYSIIAISRNIQQEYRVIKSDIDIKNIEYKGTWDFWK